MNDARGWLGTRGGPVVLHDDSSSDHLARMIVDVGLVQRMSDVATSGCKVSEVSDHDEVVVVVEVTRVIATRHGE